MALSPNRTQVAAFASTPSVSQAVGGPDTAGASLAFDLVTSQLAFDALAADWRKLHAEHGLPHQIFLSYNWLWHWANVFIWQAPRPQSELAVLVGRDAGCVVMIWPLVITRTLGLSVLSWMGEPVNQYGDVLATDAAASPASFTAAWAFIAKRLAPDIIHFRKVRADARIAAPLTALDCTITETAAAPFIGIDPSIDLAAFEAGFSAKDRKNRRRHRKRLAERGEVVHETYSGCPSAAAAVARTIALKRDWLRQRELVSAAVMAPQFETFFHDALCDTERPTGCELSMLLVAGRPAAMTIGIRNGTYYAAHLTSYDPELEAYSPGSLLLEGNLRRLHRLGVTTHDLLAPAFPYKLHWTQTSVAIADYARSLTVRGRLYRSVYLSRLRPQLRRIADDHSSPWKQLLFRAMQLRGRQ